MFWKFSNRLGSFYLGLYIKDIYLRKEYCKPFRQYQSKTTGKSKNERGKHPLARAPHLPSSGITIEQPSKKPNSGGFPHRSLLKGGGWSPPGRKPTLHHHPRGRRREGGNALRATQREAPTRRWGSAESKNHRDGRNKPVSWWKTTDHTDETSPGVHVPTTRSAGKDGRESLNGSCIVYSINHKLEYKTRFITNLFIFELEA